MQNDFSYRKKSILDVYPAVIAYSSQAICVVLWKYPNT